MSETVEENGPHIVGPRAACCLDAAGVVPAPAGASLLAMGLITPCPRSLLQENPEGVAQPTGSAAVDGAASSPALCRSSAAFNSAGGR